jgi:pentapeptide MXKDX repeat protein
MCCTAAPYCDARRTAADARGNYVVPPPGPCVTLRTSAGWCAAAPISLLFLSIGDIPMSKLFAATALALCAAFSLSSSVYAADEMKKDEMKKDGMMKKDEMKKDGMKKDAMKKDGMKKDDAMMKKDEMKKDDKMAK